MCLSIRRHLPFGQASLHRGTPRDGGMVCPRLRTRCSQDMYSKGWSVRASVRRCQLKVNHVVAKPPLRRARCAGNAPGLLHSRRVASSGPPDPRSPSVSPLAPPRLAMLQPPAAGPVGLACGGLPGRTASQHFRVPAFLPPSATLPGASPGRSLQALALLEVSRLPRPSPPRVAAPPVRAARQDRSGSLDPASAVSR